MIYICPNCYEQNSCVGCNSWQGYCSSCNSCQAQCNACQGCNTAQTICSSQIYNKKVNICTSNAEYISYEDSWAPIITAINEIYEYEHPKQGTKTISAIAVEDLQNHKITKSIFNEVRRDLKLSEINTDYSKILGSYFDDIIYALEHNQYSDNLCNNCNTQCNGCNNCQGCNGSSQAGYTCTGCNAGCNVCQNCLLCDICVNGYENPCFTCNTGEGCTTKVNCNM